MISLTKEKIVLRNTQKEGILFQKRPLTKLFNDALCKKL